MKKVCTKFTVKTSPMSFFNFGKYPKTATACDRFLEISHFIREHEKVTFFPLCPLSFYGQDYEKPKRSGTSYQSL